MVPYTILVRQGEIMKIYIRWNHFYMASQGNGGRRKLRRIARQVAKCQRTDVAVIGYHKNREVDTIHFFWQPAWGWTDFCFIPR
jgi:hypothetical protein